MTLREDWTPEKMRAESEAANLSLKAACGGTLKSVQAKMEELLERLDVEVADYATQVRAATKTAEQMSRDLALLVDLNERIRGQYLGALTESGEPALTMREIAQIVCRKHGCTISDLKSERRHKNLVQARHEAFYLARMTTIQSYPQIGRFFGGRDHSTVVHGVRKHAERNNLPLPGCAA